MIQKSTVTRGTLLNRISVPDEAAAVIDRTPHLPMMARTCLKSWSACTSSSALQRSIPFFWRSVTFALSASLSFAEAAAAFTSCSICSHGTGAANAVDAATQKVKEEARTSDLMVRTPRLRRAADLLCQALLWREN